MLFIFKEWKMLETLLNPGCSKTKLQSNTFALKLKSDQQTRAQGLAGCFYK